MTEIRITKRDVFWSYAARFLQLGIQILIFPLIVVYLTQDELGLWYTFVSIGAIGALLDFGFNPTFCRSLTYAWSGAPRLEKEGIAPSGSFGKPNFILAKQILSTFSFFYNSLGGAFFLLMLLVGTPYVLSIAKDLDGKKVIITWVLYVSSLALNIAWGRWKNWLVALGQVTQAQKATIVMQVAILVIMIVCVCYKLGILALGISYFLGGFVDRYVSLFYYKKFIKNYPLGEEIVTWRDKKNILATIFPNTVRLGVNNVGAYLINSANTILCSAYLGLSVAGAYGITMQVSLFITSISGLYFSTYVPQFNQCRTTKEYNTIKELLSKTIFFFWGTCSLMVVCVVFWGDSVLHLIHSKTFLLPTGLLIVFLLVRFLEANHSLFATCIATDNKIPFMWPALISGVCVVFFSWISVKYLSLGVLGLIVSQGIVQLAFSNWYWPRWIYKEFQISTLYILKNGFRQNLNSCQSILKHFYGKPL